MAGASRIGERDETLALTRDGATCLGKVCLNDRARASDFIDAPFFVCSWLGWTISHDGSQQGSGHHGYPIDNTRVDL
jgi:hypothetical protein